MIKMHVVDCSLLQAHASCPSLVERWLDFFDYFLPLYGTAKQMNKLDFETHGSLKS